MITNLIIESKSLFLLDSIVVIFIFVGILVFARGERLEDVKIIFFGGRFFCFCLLSSWRGGGGGCWRGGRGVSKFVLASGAEPDNQGADQAGHQALQSKHAQTVAPVPTGSGQD